jgi:hypothetical protein
VDPANEDANLDNEPGWEGRGYVRMAVVDGKTMGHRVSSYMLRLDSHTFVDSITSQDLCSSHLQKPAGKLPQWAILR